MQSSKPWLKIVIATLFVGALGAFFAFGGDQYLSLSAIKENRDALLGYTESHYLLAVLMAVAIYTASTAFSIPGATVLSLAVGFLFGRWAGTAIILVAATLGATLVFLAARYLFAEAMQKKLGDGLAAKLISGFHDNAFHYLFNSVKKNNL